MDTDIKKVILENLELCSSLSTKEIYSLFPKNNSNTVAWHLHQAVLKGIICRNSHGNYTLPLGRIKSSEKMVSIPKTSKQAFDFMLSTGFDFYLTGLDSLSGSGFTVSGDYPVILCVKPENLKDVELSLMRQFDFAITEEECLLLQNPVLKSRIKFVVLSTTDFSLATGGFACKEKAFCDLYYAVTRLEYPIPVEELAHILSLIEPNEHRFKQATRDRKLSDELNFLLSYNKEFLASFVSYIK